MTTLSSSINRSTAATSKLNIRQKTLARIGKLLAPKLLDALSQVQWGTLSIYNFDGSHLQVGTGKAEEPAATIKINDPRFFTALALEKDIGAGRAYAQGYWESDNLYHALRIILHNESALEQLEGQYGWLTAPFYAALHKLNSNSQDQARDNISQHYDLGNDFFSAWLDPSMMYSAGFFRTEDSTLEESQYEKIDRICRKLALRPGQEVLEIGTGWGGFAIHAARKYGVNVTTTTISKEQYEFAKQAVADAGLEQQITLLLEDYRSLEGKFDAVVSIEMIEAVGYEYYDSYAEVIDRRLKPDGQVVIQAITIPDNRFDDYKQSSDFIKRFIFPGGCLPSIAALNKSFSKVSDLQLTHLEDFGRDYGKTLLLWNERFQRALPTLPEKYQDSWFKNLWEFYLLVCAALFEERRIGVCQLQLAKPGSASHHPSTQ